MLQASCLPKASIEGSYNLQHPKYATSKDGPVVLGIQGQVSRSKLYSPLFPQLFTDRFCIIHSLVQELRELTQKNRLDEALHIIERSGAAISESSAYFLLQGCGRTKDIKCARCVQSLMVKSGLNPVAVLGDHLIRLFASSGGLLEADKAFEQVLQPSVYTWSAIISAHATLGEGTTAFDLYFKLTVKKDKFVYIAVLKACITSSAHEHGRFIHDQIINSEVSSDIVLRNALIDMYAKCGRLEEAYNIFVNLPCRDVISWNAMIAAYGQHGKANTALEYFHLMQDEGIRPDKVTFLNVMKACSDFATLEHGRLIHKHIISIGLQSDDVIGNALMNMYAKCGSLAMAEEVFYKLRTRDVVSWNTMIIGYVNNSEGRLALECYKKIEHEGIKPTKVTYLNIMKACGSIQAIEYGRLIHNQIINYSLQADTLVGNALIDMYAKSGHLEEAHDVLDNLLHRDIVSWSTMIAGYAHHGDTALAVECFHGMKLAGIDPGIVSWTAIIAGYSLSGECVYALEWFEKMQYQGILPNKITFLSILRACGSVGAIEQGRIILSQIIGSGLSNDESIQCSLVDMYAKCGALEAARRVFDKLLSRDLVSWNVMIAGYAQQGEARLALDCVEDMENSGVQPDRVTFIGILMACSHAGLVEEGRWQYLRMREVYGIMPDILLYNCVVDLLGNAGCLKEAQGLLQSIQQPNIYGWISLLSSCKTYGNLNLGRQCFYKIINLDSQCVAGYILMSNIYANVKHGRC